MITRQLLALGLVATALAGCATTSPLPPTNVVRYHLGEPIARGTVSVEPLTAPGAPASLEFKTYAAAVEGELLKAGYTLPAAGATPQFVASVGFTRAEQAGPPKRSAVSVGIGGGSFSGGRHGGVGLGGGVGFPIGGGGGTTVLVAELSVTIKRRVDQSPIWEGRAQNVSDLKSADQQAGKLATALFTGFPESRVALSRSNDRDQQRRRGRMISINAAFDGGNITVVAIDGDRIDLAIAKDHLSDFYQWFSFRVAGARGRKLTLRIVNAGESAYPFGWPGYKARASSDRVDWRMIETRYERGVLSFDYEADTDLAWFAYFAPYTMEMHEALVARIALRPGVVHRQLGTSLDGQAIDYFRIGDGAKPVWLYARQHPGESMAEWWMDGALDWLTSPAAAPLLAKATVHVVPNMNPDGTRRGHLRTNAAGVNLNREWHAPSLEKSPEVLCVRNAMDETGVVYAIDVHGDEAIPANFIAGFEGIPGWTDERGAKFTEFGRRLAAHTPDFQVEKGYEKSAPGRANLSMSTNQVAERYGAVSMTLEMPFKDHDPNPDAEFGWSADRSKRLGVACLETLTGMIDEL